MSELLRRYLRASICATALAAVVGGLVASSATLVQAQESGLGLLANARPGEVRLFVAGSLRAAVLTVRGRLEQVTGRKVVIESSESRHLKEKIEAGQAFEVAILVTEIINDLSAKGKIVAGSATLAGIVLVGVAVRGDAPQLDIATAEGLRRAIVGARSVRRNYGVGASVPILDNLFTKLGLLESTRHKMISISAVPAIPEAPLPRGQYELTINLIGAIKPMPGWNYLGPIPAEFQSPTSHSVGLGAAGDLALGRQVMTVLKGPEFAAAKRTFGITAE